MLFKLFLILNIFFHSYSFDISRRLFIVKNINNIININNNNNKAIIIGYDNIGLDIYKELRKYNYKTTITTTKPARISKIQDDYNSVVLIPQMEIGKDEIFRNTINNNNDLIIISDIISIFSIHTFVRTCQRVVNAIKDNNKKTIVCLISSCNIYGAHTDGAIVNENSGIVNQRFINNNNKDWKINHLSNSKAIQLGENYLLELAKINPNIKPIILRTSSIWNDKIEKNNFKFNNNKSYLKKIGDSYMSLSYTKDIAKSILLLSNNNHYGIYNCVSNSFLRKNFYKNINWIINDNTNINNYNDNYYSTDINPLLPNAQRYNMIVDNSKLKKLLRFNNF